MGRLLILSIESRPKAYRAENSQDVFSPKSDGSTVKCASIVSVVVFGGDVRRTEGANFVFGGRVPFRVGELSLTLNEIPKNGPKHHHHQAGIKDKEKQTNNQICYKKVTPYRKCPFQKLRSSKFVLANNLKQPFRLLLH